MLTGAPAGAVAAVAVAAVALAAVAAGGGSTLSCSPECGGGEAREGD